MSHQHRRKQRFKLKSFYVWHRYMGVSAALFLLVIAATGILLNHTEDLKLDSRFVDSDWLLDWYGIQAPDTLVSFSCADRFITLMGQHLYLDRREIDGNYRQLSGAVCTADMLVVAVNNSILLLTPGGELIEQLQGEDGIPAGISRIGLDNSGRVVVHSSHDDYQADNDFTNWRRTQDNRHIDWAQPAALEPGLQASLQHHYREEVLPIERVMLDLHSGRLFGRLGPWLFDFAAVLLILLSLSGSWIWLKRRR
jgi:hypothetical protein